MADQLWAINGEYMYTDELADILCQHVFELERMRIELAEVTGVMTLPVLDNGNFFGVGINRQAQNQAMAQQTWNIPLGFYDRVFMECWGHGGGGGVELNKESIERSIFLLRGWLSPEQLLQYSGADQSFDVIGSHTGKRYRITSLGQSFNVREMSDDGQTMLCHWCFEPQGNLPAGDRCLAQKIALETDEIYAMTVANGNRNGQHVRFQVPA